MTNRWRILLTALCCVVTAPAYAEFSWSSLWRTPDQRGDALLSKGDAAQAAAAYADPRRRAHAEIKAGNYAQAARELEPLHDAESLYNRGNALAHTGDLQGAIDAYDAALKQDPKNADARHNRELVAKAMEQQKPPPQSAGGNAGKDGKQGGGSDKQSGSQSEKGTGAGDKGNDNGNDNSNDSGKQADTGAAQKPGQGAGQQAGDRGKPGSSGVTQQPGQGSSREPNQGTSGGESEKGTQGKAVSGDSAEEAKKDAQQGAAASQQTQSRDRGANGSALEAAAAAELTADKPAAGQTRSATPRSETQMAEEQWLRAIPDDPAGLLQRKFLIEHLLRQQGKAP